MRLVTPCDSEFADEYLHRLPGRTLLLPSRFVPMYVYDPVHGHLGRVRLTAYQAPCPSILASLTVALPAHEQWAQHRWPSPLPSSFDCQEERQRPCEPTHGSSSSLQRDLSPSHAVQFACASQPGIRPRLPM